MQSVLDVSSPENIEVASELELSREEDSVTTLAAGLRKNRTLLVYAGINSSLDDIQKGKNEHFRVFGIDQPARSRSNSTHKITELSRSTIFNSKDADTYQRLLRVAPSFSGTHQVGAVATGLAKSSEITIFEVSTAAGVAPKPRGKLELLKEAMDLDVIQVDEDRWQLAYCDDFVLNILDIGKTESEPSNIFTTPIDIATGYERPTFRCIRYLTPHFLLAASNMHKGSGVVLQGFRLPISAEQGGKAKLAVSARLPKSVTRATCLAVRNLSPTSSPSANQGDTQFVIAVAGQDSSITLYTLEHTSHSNIELIVKLHPITTLKSVHPSPISGLAFSYIPPPQPPKTASVSTTPTAPRQHTLKLASVGSMGNTVVAHHIPLRRLSNASKIPGAPPRPPRHVVALKSRGPNPTSVIIFGAIIIAVLGALLQGILEVGGLVTPSIGARHVVPERWLKPLPPHVSGDFKDTARVGTHAPFLAEFLAEQKLNLNSQGEGEGAKVVLTADTYLDGETGGEGVKVDAHDEERHADAKSWDELPLSQKRAWRKRLEKAGQWGEEMGETIFKGVLFSEIGGAIGQMVAG
ncbi:hypothetical protein CONLIGDRAFT_628985 [Coniochaeta ligniaria NRRL 30616]|uniref:Guanine nucleotide-exchange factor SEC12 n=1 Tax=Coniochaeta ligniaria NRRL 30616 TaxID=1408157 RepID=A0A1J7J1W9_9PEZI|nr:hypothetical protein CONLIGDRAFT_628985 [Coniochaeta ligniaria NRRL 30616]